MPKYKSTKFPKNFYELNPNPFSLITNYFYLSIKVLHFIPSKYLKLPRIFFYVYSFVFFFVSLSKSIIPIFENFNDQTADNAARFAVALNNIWEGQSSDVYSFYWSASFGLCPWSLVLDKTQAHTEQKRWPSARMSSPVRELNLFININVETCRNQKDPSISETVRTFTQSQRGRQGAHGGWVCGLRTGLHFTTQGWVLPISTSTNIRGQGSETCRVGNR